MQVSYVGISDENKKIVLDRMEELSSNLLEVKRKQEDNITSTEENSFDINILQKKKESLEIQHSATLEELYDILKVTIEADKSALRKSKSEDDKENLTERIDKNERILKAVEEEWRSILKRNIAEKDQRAKVIEEGMKDFVLKFGPLESWKSPSLTRQKKTLEGLKKKLKEERKKLNKLTPSFFQRFFKKAAPVESSMDSIQLDEISSASAGIHEEMSIEELDAKIEDLTKKVYEAGCRQEELRGKISEKKSELSEYEKEKDTENEKAMKVLIDLKYDQIDSEYGYLIESLNQLIKLEKDLEKCCSKKIALFDEAKEKLDKESSELKESRSRLISDYYFGVIRYALDESVFTDDTELRDNYIEVAQKICNGYDKIVDTGQSKKSIMDNMKRKIFLWSKDKSIDVTDFCMKAVSMLALSPGVSIKKHLDNLLDRYKFSPEAKQKIKDKYSQSIQYKLEPLYLEKKGLESVKVEEFSSEELENEFKNLKVISGGEVFDPGEEAKRSFIPYREPDEGIIMTPVLHFRMGKYAVVADKRNAKAKKSLRKLEGINREDFKEVIQSYINDCINTDCRIDEVLGGASIPLSGSQKVDEENFYAYIVIFDDMGEEENIGRVVLMKEEVYYNFISEVERKKKSKLELRQEEHQDIIVGKGATGGVTITELGDNSLPLSEEEEDKTKSEELGKEKGMSDEERTAKFMSLYQDDGVCDKQGQKSTKPEEGSLGVHTEALIEERRSSSNSTESDKGIEIS